MGITNENVVDEYVKRIIRLARRAVTGYRTRPNIANYGLYLLPATADVATGFTVSMNCFLTVGHRLQV